jgi:BirA family biotin operon repressor/biotin-[acetyl-CoA-carboxylase] ligase
MSTIYQTSYGYNLLEILSEEIGVLRHVRDLTCRLGGGQEDVGAGISQLERLGFPIFRSPEGHVSLRPGLDILDRDLVNRRIGCIPLGREIHCHLEVGSTNDLAMDAAKSGAPHGAVFVSEHQTKGRGRLARSWFSPPGAGLWFSVVLRLDLELSKSWMMTLGAASAVACAVESTCGITPDLKWPNDLRCQRRKVGGILAEAVPSKERLEVAVLGIGINVNQDKEEFPANMQDHAISLKQATGHTISRSELLASILVELNRTYSSLEPERVRDAWLARTRMLGSRVRVVVENRTLVGIAEDLTLGGALVVRDSVGERHSIDAGEVEQLRD